MGWWITPTTSKNTHLQTHLFPITQNWILRRIHQNSEIFLKIQLRQRQDIWLCWQGEVLLVPIIFDDKTREIYWGFCWEYWLVKCKFYKFWQVNACPGRCSLGQEQWVMDRRIWSLEKRNNVCFKRLNASGEKTKFKAHTTKCQATDRFPSFPTTWWFPKLAHIETLANLK